MKTVFILAALASVVAFTSCNGSSNNNTATEAGQKIDEMVNDAKDALDETADSISIGVDKATDSLNAAADTLTNGE